MAILGFFKKDKVKAPSSQASSSSLVVAVAVDDAASTEDYVLSPPSLVLPTAGNGDDDYASSSASFVSAASSKKIRLPFGRKSPAACQSPLTRPYEPAQSMRNISSDKLSLSPDASLDTSSRASVFRSFHHSNSSPALSRPDTNSRPQLVHMQKSDSPNPPKSSGGLFGWRERKKSKTAMSDSDSFVLPPLADDSFNLKSFRHVLPEPRPNSPQSRSPAQSPSPSSLAPPARPRGASVASTDSAQRISVAAFREAQARRSSTNLVSGSPSPTIRPVSVANSMVSDIALPRPPRTIRPPASASPTPARGEKTAPSRHSRLSSSPDASSSEESESEDYSPSRSCSRLSRQRTITKRSYGASSDLGHGTSRVVNYSHHQQTTSTRSELGHGLSARTPHASPSPSRGPPPSSFQRTAEVALGTRSFSFYRRQRASYSTSELNPNAAAQRASTLVEANKRELAAAQRRRRGDSDTSDSSSESDSSDDEDAPLAALKRPKRPGSAISHSSNGTAAPRKPLIDLNMKSNPLSGKPLMDVNGAEQHRARAALVSPTNINGRLSRLALAAGLGDHRNNSASKSATNLSRVTRPSFVDPSNPDSPASTDTITPPLRIESLKPVAHGPRRASFSALSVAQVTAQSKIDDLQPVPIKDHPERNAGFRVVSRPQKSATTPPSFVSSADASSNQPSKQPITVSHHHPSSSSAFNVTSRPQSSMPALATKPLVAASQNGSSTSASGSSVSGTSSSPRVIPTIQKSPQKPFVFGGKRQESPASSTGGSSNGKAPLTPMDGSDYFSPDVRGSGDSPGGSSVSAAPPSAMKGGRGHMKRASVSFQEPMDLDKDDTVRGRKSSAGLTKAEEQDSVEERENRRRERRRSEAKAAIELGNVINGRGPVEHEDDNEDLMIAPRIPPMNTGGGMGLNFSNMQMGWQQQGMSSTMMGGMGGMGSLGPMGGTPGMSMGMNMGLNPSQFMVTPPPQGADPGFLVAHQQAMRIAKQAYQYAVAQQAMAAAADEWERGSSVSAFTSPASGMGMGMGGGGGGYGMGGMNGMWGGVAPMFPAAPRSMYGGSNVGAAMSEAGWGTASVYGESFGPSMPTNARRPQMLNSQMRNSSGGGSGGAIGSPGSYQRAESAGNVQQTAAPSSRNAPRPRTRTAPSNTPLPTQYRQGRGPPSSWKVGI